VQAFPPGAVRTPHAKAAREYHLIDLTGISHGGFVSLAGARQFARQEALSGWDIFHGNDRIEYHDPDDRERSEVKAKQDHAPTHYPPSKADVVRNSLMSSIAIRGGVDPPAQTALAWEVCPVRYRAQRLARRKRENLY